MTKKNLSLAVAILSLIIANQLFAQDYKTIEGRITNRADGKPLAYVHVSIKGTTIMTVSNTEGRYIIKIPADKADGKLLFSLVGYFNHEISIAVLQTGVPYDVQLSQEATVLEEVDISITTPESIIKKAIDKITLNYFQQPTLLRAFYREVGDINYSHGRVAEAVLDVYKSPYTGFYTGGHEDVKLIKGRELGVDDTVAEIIWSQPGVMQGGPVYIIQQDPAKHPNSVFFPFIRSDYMNKFNYKLAGKKKVNGRDTYIITFDQKAKVLESLYEGEIMIDAETFAFTKLQYKLSQAHLKDAKPIRYQGIEITKIEDYSIVEYNLSSQNRWYLAYTMQGETYQAVAKTRKTKEAYAKTFAGRESITSGKILELFVNELITENVKSIPPRERLTLKDMVYDRDTVNDEAFWQQYNFVKLESSLREAFKR